MGEWVTSLAGGFRRRLLLFGACLAMTLAVAATALATAHHDGPPASAASRGEALLDLLDDDDGRATPTSTSTSIATSTTESTVPTTDPPQPGAGVPGTSSSTSTTGRAAARAATAPPVTEAPPAPAPLVTLPPVTTIRVPVTVPATVAPPPQAGRDTAAEATFASAYARHRSSLGLAPVARHSGLDGVAARWAARLADTGQLAHNPNAGSQVVSACGAECTGWAENVGMDATVQGVWTSFLGSGSHRANLDDRATRYHGLAIVPRNGILWVVHVFGRV